MKKVLVIEGDDIAYRSINQQLKQIGYTPDHILRCSRLHDVAIINAEEIELILTCLNLPDSGCETTFKGVKEKFPFKPIIILTGVAEKEVAIKTIHEGAQDYLLKGEFNQKMLEKAIQYAIERNRILDNVSTEKRNLRAIINNTKDIIWSVDKKYNVILANKAYWDRIYLITGKTKEEVGPSDFDKELMDIWMGFYEKALKGELNEMIWSETCGGNKIYEEVRFNLIRDKDKNILGVNCFSRDITKEYSYIEMIKKQNGQLREIAWIQSHEVRGPVATMMGIANLFNMDNPGDPENIELMESIKLLANKLDDVISKINSQTGTSPLDNGT